MKSAVVVGARSMLGDQLSARLQALGVTVLTAGRSPTDDIFCDLDDKAPAETGEASADAVFHCAASFAGDDEDGVRQNFSINAAGALKVARLSQDVGAGALIYAGSVSSDERLDPGNFSSYGLTKKIAEQLLSWSAQRRHGRFCSLRFAQLYDTEGRCCERQPWFGRIVAYAARGQDIRMPPSLGVRNFVHVRDAADMMIRAARSGACGELDIVHPVSLTCRQIAEIAYRVFAKGGKVVEAAEKAPFRRIDFPDPGPAFERLGLSPSIGMEDGLRLIGDAGTFEAFGPMDVT